MKQNEAATWADQLARMRCFGCAPKSANPAGLNLVFEETETGARAQFNLSEVFQSYPGFLHGGILASVLDETMGYAGLLKKGWFPFTRKIETIYRRAVSAERTYLCEAEIETISESGYSAKAVILEEAKTALVVAKADFAFPTLVMAKRMLGPKKLAGYETFFRS